MGLEKQVRAVSGVRGDPLRKAKSERRRKEEGHQGIRSERKRGKETKNNKDKRRYNTVGKAGFLLRV